MVFDPASKISKNETNKKTEKKDKPIAEETRQAQELPSNKKGKLKQNIIFFVIFCITAIFMYWTNQVTTPQNNMLVMFITLSVLFNIIIILILFGTGIGIELVFRFLNKFRYKSGNFVNTLQIMKSGVVKERFIKKDTETGTFRIIDKPYVTNPRLMFNYKGIPTYFHREGNPDPLNIWEDNLAGDLSNSEMDIAMNSKGAFDVKAWLDKNKSLLGIISLIVVAVSIGAAFFGYQTYEMLRDGTFKQITSVACNNIPDPVQKVVETALGG